MAIKVTLKNSVVQDSVPTTSHLAAVGELALNANINSLGIYMRASDNSIVKMAGPGSLTTPAASLTVAGIAELATSAETTTGTDAARVVTPAGLKVVTDAERTTSNSSYMGASGGTMTGALTMPNGSNSAPSVNFGDTDSGVFGGTNTVSLTAGGTTRLTADTGVSVVGTLAVTGAITSTSDLTIADKIIHSGDTNTAIRFPAADTVSIETGSSERARVDSSGHFLIGTSSAQSTRVGSSGFNPLLQISSDVEAAASFTRFSNSTDSGRLSIQKGRGTTGSKAIVQNNDTLGQILFSGWDGDTFTNGSSIISEVDGTPGDDDMPGRLVFNTTANGAASPTTRLTIDSSGLVNVPDNGKFTCGASDDLQIYHSGSGSYIRDVGTGTLYLDTNGNAISLISDGSVATGLMGRFFKDGAVELYFDGTKKCYTDPNGLKFNDNDKVLLGNSSDLQIYHDGSNSFISESGTGGLNISSNVLNIYNSAVDEYQARFIQDDRVELYFNSVKQFQTTSTGITVNDLRLGDSTNSADNAVLLGADLDMRLYHDGSNGVIQNDTGVLYLQNDAGGGDIQIRAKAGENSIRCQPDLETSLFYDGAEKLETTSTGVSISGDSSINGNLDLAGGVFIGGSDHYLYQDSATRVSFRVGPSGGTQVYGGFASQESSFAVGNASGDLRLTTGNASPNPKTSVLCRNNGSVELYNDNALRLATVLSGVDLYGTTCHMRNPGGDVHVEIGYAATSNQNAYIDFIGDSTYSDYGLRILRGNAGANTSSVIKHRGTGIFQIGSQDGGKVCFGLFQDGYAFDNVSYAAVQITSAGVASLATRQNSTGAQTAVSFFNPNGRVGYIGTNGSATSYNTSSDYRLKENTVAISDGITRLKTLKPYRFNFKSDPDVTVDGFFAHEVTAVPESITGTKDATHDLTYVETDDIPEGKEVGDVKESGAPLYQCIDQSKIVPLLTAALQEAIAKIETLETKVAALEGA